MHRLFQRIGFALAAPLLVLTLVGPAFAAVDQASSHYIAPNWNFQQCRRQIQRALRAEEMTVVEEGANTGDFRGYSNTKRDGSGSLDTAVVNCWSTNGGMRITFACASQTPNNDAVAMCNRLIASVFQNTGGVSPNCASPVGTWNWWNGGTSTFNADGTANSNGYQGRWERLSDGRYHVHWSYPSDDYFTISADGRSMPGNYNGTAGTSTRRGNC
jgi:hypothetical protein